MTRQVRRATAFREAYKRAHGEFRYIGKHGHKCYTIPRKARRRIGRAWAKQVLAGIR